MRAAEDSTPVKLFSTCPPVSHCSREEYPARVREAARWSEAAGCEGMLVYSDNRQLDPWSVAHCVLDATVRLAPLVAVQPIYGHPYAVAKQIASLGYLYERRVYLNMVAGGFKRDLEALGDPTAHDDRYDRLIEYTTLLNRLLQDREPVTCEGRFYRARGLKLHPPLAGELLPGILISGSSEAGARAARMLGATAVRYPGPPSRSAGSRAEEAGEDVALGFRVGILARESREEAWKEAHARFPRDRRGALLHQMAMKVSDSVWHRELSDPEREEEGPYWMRPFNQYQTFCPYLVGSHEEIAAELSLLVGRGARTFIFDVPREEQDLLHVQQTFDLVLGVPAS